MKRFFSSSVVAIAAIAGLAVLVAPGCGTEQPVDLGQVGEGPVIARGSRALEVGEVCATGGPCAPGGAHGNPLWASPTKHGKYECKTCHYVGGKLQFDPAGPAVGAGQPLPSFDATAKTCSNVACHTVPAGTFSYYFPGGDGEPVLNTVPYGGGAAQTTPSWYSSSAGCSACHVSPPLYNGTPYPWHSGSHGGTNAYNDCQLCHLDATSSYQGGGVWNNVGLSTATNCTVNGVPNQACSKLHANGSLNVNATFKTQCFGCH